MRRRIIVLTSIVAAAAGVMVAAGPLLLVPAPGSPLASGPGPGNIAIGDLDRDGAPDMVVTRDDRRISILRGRGDGRFSMAPDGTIDMPIAPSELALGDVNGDGHHDLAVAGHDSYDVVLLLGDGRGRLRPAPGSPIAMKDGRNPHTHDLAIADFNGDGRADILTVNSNDDNDVAVALGDGRGGFARAPGSPFAVGPGPYPSAVGDLDADGRLDVVVTSTGFRTGAVTPAPGDRLMLLFGDGRGGFRRTDVAAKTGHTWFAAIGDVNGDKRADVVATHLDTPVVTVLLGDGRGNLAEARGSPFAMGGTAWHLAMTDVNRDGRIDLLGASRTGIRVLVGDGRGGFAEAPGSMVPTGNGTWQLAVADVNADGRSDVAATNVESGNVSVLLGR